LTVYFLGSLGQKVFPISLKLMRHTLKLTAQQPACCSLGKFITQIQALKRQKGDLPHRIGQTKGGLNSKRHAVCDGQGRPVVMLLSEGQMSDYTGTKLMLDVLPSAKCFLVDRGYDADWFCKALRTKGIDPCIPPRKSQKKQIEYDKMLYKQRHKIENMFGKIKDWRRIALRYDRCAHTFFSARCRPAVVIFHRN